MVTGSGSSGDPFLLYNLSDLEQIPILGLNKYYKLAVDIDASVTSDENYNNGEGWLPLGTFTGGFDGNNKTISGLYINRASTDNNGLFSIINSNNVKNLTISNPNITGRDYVGGIAGQFSSGSASGLSVSGGSISGRNYVGGICGYHYGNGGSKTITASVNGTTINATGQYVGGITGRIYYSAFLSSCSVTNASILGVDTTAQVGGIVGYVGQYNTSGGVTSCSISGCTITGLQDVGGIIGQVSTSGTNTMSSCSVENTSLTGKYRIGGIIGYAYGTIDLNSTMTITSTTINGISGGSDLGGVVGNINYGSKISDITVTSSCEVIGSSTTDNVGGIVGYVKNYGGIKPDITGCTVQCDVTGRTNVGGLAGRATSLNSCVNNAVDGSTVTATNYGGMVAGYLYQSNTVGYNSLKGTLAVTSDRAGGVTGRCHASSSINGAVVTSDVIFSLGANCDYVGGIAGDFTYFTSTGTIQNCKVRGISIIGRDYIGGIVGTNITTNVLTKNYAINISITGRHYVGGVVGSNTGSLSLCHSSGVIDASSAGGDYVGGIAGRNTSSTFNNSYSLCTVIGDTIVGGAVGQTTAAITNIYSSGAVTGNSSVGGLVGSNSGGSATNCYWDTETSGQVLSALGVGKTTEEMQTQSTFVDWDFNTPIWAITPLNNYGYPFLMNLFFNQVISDIGNIGPTELFGCDKV